MIFLTDKKKERNSANLLEINDLHSFFFNSTSFIIHRHEYSLYKIFEEKQYHQPPVHQNFHL